MAYNTMIGVLLLAILQLSTCLAKETCTGGQTWTKCGSCMWTCDDVPVSEMACAAVCREGCECPEDRPVWHDGFCITEFECPGGLSTESCEAQDVRYECEAGEGCRLQEVQCIQAPCPAVPVCVDLAKTLCAATSCMQGSVCTLQEVQCVTTPCEPVATCVDADICKLSKEVGPCEALIPSWYYDKEDGQCKSFDYGGCDGNENRFISKSACEMACGSYDPCTDVSCEPGFGCVAKDVVCVKAPCLPVAECVDLADECDTMSCRKGQVCKLTEVESCEAAPCRPEPVCVDADICSQPQAVVGDCDALMPRFYYNRWSYNSNDNNCEQFEYGGCGGNENRFLSRSACEKTCQNADVTFCPVGTPMVNYTTGATVCCGHCLQVTPCPSTHFCHVHPADAFIVCCEREDLTPCQKSKLMSENPNIMDYGSVDCDADGNFVKKQCDGFRGACYCVTEEEGREIPGSSVQGQGDVDLDCDANKFKQYYVQPLCRAEMGKAEAERGTYTPSCDEFGLYEKKQCYTVDGDGECWCVTTDGAEVPESRRPYSERLDCGADQFKDFYNSYVYRSAGEEGTACYSCRGSSSGDDESCFTPDPMITPGDFCTDKCMTTTDVNQVGFTIVTRGCNDVVSCTSTDFEDVSCCDSSDRCNGQTVKDNLDGAGCRPQALWLALLLGAVSVFLNVML